MSAQVAVTSEWWVGEVALGATSAGGAPAMGSNQGKQVRTLHLGKPASPATSQGIPKSTTSSSRSLTKSPSLDTPFAALANLLGDFTLIVDFEGTVQNAYVNGQNALNSHPSALPGQRIGDLIGKKNYRILDRAIRGAVQCGIKTHTQYSIDGPNARRFFESLIIPLDHRKREPKRIALLLRDITAHKQSEEKSHTNEALLQQAEELARIGSFKLDLRTGAGTWSKQLYRNFQIDPGQPITGKMFLDMVHPDDRARLIREVDEGVARKQILDSEFRFVLPSGEVRILHRRAVPIFDEAGTPVSIVGMSQDITERRRVEDELRNREALLSQAERLANMGSWDWNLESSQVAWSDHRYRLLGFDPETQAPDVNAFWKRVHSEDLDRVRREFDAAVREVRPVEYEARFVLSDGTVRILHSRGVPVLNSEGRVVRIRGMAQDVTERRAEEERLRHGEALLAHAEEIANVGSWEFDVLTGRTLLSRHLLRMYGLKDEREWDLELYWKRLQVSDADAIRTEVMRSVEHGRPFEFTAPYRMPDGTIRIYRTVGKPVLGKDGAPAKVLGVVHDITEHIRTEESLRNLSQQLIRTRDNERRQLARGLHETAGQTLAALKMTLGNLEEFLPEDNASAREQLKAVRGFAEDAVREIRLVSYLMYPPLLDDAGLTPAVSWYVRGFSERSGIQATVEIADGLGRYPQEIETTVFSIVQEALTNVHRYSGSTSVNVRLSCEGDSLRTEIEDHGSGLPVMAPAKGYPSGFGVGIAAMRERVKELNGLFEILSTPGRGTLVRAILPFPRQEAARLSSSSSSSNRKPERRKGKITAGSQP